MLCVSCFSSRVLALTRSTLGFRRFSSSTGTSTRFSSSWLSQQQNVGGRNVAFLSHHPSMYHSSSVLKMVKKDDSVASKSRMPFSAPQNVPDDSSSEYINNEEEGMLAWSRLGLTSDIVDLLLSPKELDERGRNWGGMGFVDGPTPVQHMAIPAILSGFAGERKQHICFAAATGSGKTLAYLLPILQSIKSQEMIADNNDNNNNYGRKVKRPKALILAPTRELAQQIYSVCKELSHVVKVSSQLIIGGDSMGTQRKKLTNSPVDIIVASPGRLVKHVQQNNVFLGEVQHVVMDEMDTMLEQGFQADLGHLLHILLYRRQGKISPLELPTLKTIPEAPQVILTTATMTQAVQRLLKNEKKKNYYGQKQQVVVSSSSDQDFSIVLPTKQMRILTAPGLHRAVPRLRQIFVDVGNADKVSLLIDVIVSNNQSSKEGGLTLVFCNTVSSSRAAQHALAEASIPSLGYHGQLSSTTRAENLQSFRQHKVDVLVCTDIAARGLDVPEVDHVVMFDFPLNPIDYIHRAGRTARGKHAGNGRVTALVAKRDQVLAMAIENAVQKGEPLDTLSSRKSDYVNNTPKSSTSSYDDNNNRRRRGGGTRRSSTTRRSNNNSSRRTRRS